MMIFIDSNIIVTVIITIIIIIVIFTKISPYLQNHSQQRYNVSFLQLCHNEQNALPKLLYNLIPKITYCIIYGLLHIWICQINWKITSANKDALKGVVDFHINFVYLEKIGLMQVLILWAYVINLKSFLKVLGLVFTVE